MSSTSSRVVGTIAFVVGFLGGVHAQETGTPRTSMTGNEVYDRGCVSCHGPDGQGVPRNAGGLDVPDFTDCRFSSPEADPDWHTVIEFGGPVRGFDRLMPSFKDALTSEEIDNVVGYLRGFCRDPRWPLGDLNLPRPLVTEKAYPENEAVVTTTYESADGTSIGNSIIYERRVGARGQYELVVPFDVRRNDGGKWNRGLGDVAGAFKQVLLADAKAGSILSAGGEVTFPTGKESSGLGGGVTMLEPFVMFGQILPSQGFLHIQGGFERSTNHDRANDETFLRAAIGRSFEQPAGGRIWSPMLELVGARDLGTGERTRWDMVPQLQITLNQRQHLVLNVGAQLPVTDRQGRGRKLLFYFLWDWFDGGLLEGW
jgi:hypothetical protein